MSLLRDLRVRSRPVACHEVAAPRVVHPCTAVGESGALRLAPQRPAASFGGPRRRTRFGKFELTVFKIYEFFANDNTIKLRHLSLLYLNLIHNFVKS